MRVLLTGASGYLGRRLAAALARRHPTVGTYLKESAPIPGCSLARLDVGDEADVLRCFQEATPDLVIHGAALANPERCEERREEARRVNVEGTRSVARACRTSGARLIYISTDLVFDGTKPPYRETDAPNPLNFYARTKREGELGALELCPDAVVVRLALGYGFKRVGEPTFTDWLFATLSQGKKAKLFTDQVRAAVYLADAADMMAALADLTGRKGVPGSTFHLAGPAGISRFRFGEIFCSVFGFKTGLLEPVRMADVPSPAPRPRDCTLDGTKLRSLLGFRPAGVEEGLRRLRGERAA